MFLLFFQKDNKKMINKLTEWEKEIRPSAFSTEKNFNSILNKNTTKFT